MWLGTLELEKRVDGKFKKIMNNLHEDLEFLESLQNTAKILFSIKHMEETTLRQKLVIKHKDDKKIWMNFNKIIV